jgi:hypothetical protein
MLKMEEWKAILSKRTYLMGATSRDEDELILSLVNDIWPDLPIFPKIRQVIISQESLLVMNGIAFTTQPLLHPVSKYARILP